MWCWDKNKNISVPNEKYPPVNKSLHTYERLNGWSELGTSTMMYHKKVHKDYLREEGRLKITFGKKEDQK